MADITTKAGYQELSQRGLLGNFLKSYDTLEELEASGYEGFLTIRARDKQSPWFVSCVSTIVCSYPDIFNVMSIHAALCDIQDKGGPDDRSFYFQQVPPPSTRRVANIEAGYVNHQLVAYVESDTIEPVRGIRERVKPVYGVRAKVMLQTLLSADSFDTLYEIWWTYPDAVIEATEFSQACGEFNKKLVVWEVREY